jgi:hypothetical protein
MQLVMQNEATNRSLCRSMMMLATWAVVACGDLGAPEATPDVAMLGGAQQLPSSAEDPSEVVISAGVGPKARGVAGYGLQVAAAEVNVRLLDEAGQEVGTLRITQQGDRRHVRFVGADRTFDFDYNDDRVEVEVDGESRGALLLLRGNNPPVDDSALELGDTRTGVALVASVTNDPELRQALAELAGPPIQADQHCPWWMALGVCLAAESNPGKALCTACLALQVVEP